MVAYDSTRQNTPYASMADIPGRTPGIMQTPIRLTRAGVQSGSRTKGGLYVRLHFMIALCKLARQRATDETNTNIEHSLVGEREHQARPASHGTDFSLCMPDDSRRIGSRSRRAYPG
eukprot:1122430-Pyramimonas_sp.AAC.1